MAVTAIEAREPVTVPILKAVAVLTAELWLRENCVALIIWEIVVPNGTPPPETGWPTTSPLVLVVVIVALAVPTAVIPKEALAVPICAAVVGAEVICQVPELNFVTAAADVVLLMIPRISLVAVLAPPSTSL